MVSRLLAEHDDGDLALYRTRSGKYEFMSYPGGREMNVVFSDVELTDRCVILYKEINGRQHHVGGIERADLGDVEIAFEVIDEIAPEYVTEVIAERLGGQEVTH